MSSIPDFDATVQEIAQKLTPTERHLLARAGAPRWFDLPHPWQPTPSQLEGVRHHLHGPAALFAPVPHYLGAYELTDLGECVAGWFLAGVFAFVLETEGDLDPDEVAGRLTPDQRHVLCQAVSRGSLHFSSFSHDHAVALGLSLGEWGVLVREGLTFRPSALGLVVADLLVGVRDGQ